MKISPIVLSRLEEIERIHGKHFQTEFGVPNFLDRGAFICSFLVTDNDDNIVCAAGVRNICESVIITDKDMPLHKKLEALNKVYEASKVLARQAGHHELHAFVESTNTSWIRWLQKAGFVPTKGQAFVLDLTNG